MSTTSHLSRDDYLELSEKTLSEEFHCGPDELSKQKLLHAAIGISTEAGELLDQLKKHLFYGRELDKVNLQEELGDLFRYIAIVLRECDYDPHEIMALNIEKLKKRYGEKFSAERANKRDTDHELSHIDDK